MGGINLGWFVFMNTAVPWLTFPITCRTPVRLVASTANGGFPRVALLLNIIYSKQEILSEGVRVNCIFFFFSDYSIIFPFFFFCSSPFSRLSFIIGYNSLRSVQLDSISKVKFTANSVQFKPWLWHESRQNKSLSVKIYEIIFIQFNQSIKSVNIDRCQLHSWMVYDRTQIMIKYDEAKPDGKKSNQIWSITLV